VNNNLLNGAADFNMMGYSRLFTGIFSSIIIVDLIRYKNRNYNEYTIVKYIGLSGLMQAFIVLSTYIYPDFKSLLIATSGRDETYLTKIEAFSEFRGIGWTYVQYADFALCMGIAFLCFITSKYSTCSSSVKNLLWMFLMFIYILGGVLVARTFFMFIACGILLFILLAKSKYGFMYSTWMFLKFGMILSVSFYALFSYLSSQGIISETSIHWMLELFYNYDESGSLETDSTNQLMDELWFLPSDINTLIFGDGRFSGSDEYSTYAHSDSGYVNSIYYWGLLGTALLYYSIFKSFDYTAKLSKQIDIKYLCYIILFTILIYNMKGVANGFPYAWLIFQGILSANRT
ncbi:hypothetical protein, partial [Parabacteroides sp.]